MRDARLTRADVVWVKSPAEILETLDSTGTLDGVPFMPEMIEYCGQRLIVSERTEKLCDTINASLTSRRLPNCVILEGIRCNGGGHGGCQAACTIYWHETWLSKSPVKNAATEMESKRGDLLERTSQAARVSDEPNCFMCQATEMVRATTPLSGTDPRPYVRELTSGNVPVGRFVRVMTRAAWMQPLHKAGRLDNTVVRGATSKTPISAPLNLQPGELVRVKTKDQIQTTVTNQGRSRGLWFDREMLAFCGNTYRVKDRIRRIVDERTGELLEFDSDCITLEDVYCKAECSVGRWFCPRRIPPYWREAWLERSEPGDEKAG